MRERRSAAPPAAAIAGGGGADKVPVVRVPRFRDSATAFAVARRFRFASRGVARGGLRRCARTADRAAGRPRAGRSPPPANRDLGEPARARGGARAARRAARAAAGRRCAVADADTGQRARAARRGAARAAAGRVAGSPIRRHSGRWWLDRSEAELRRTLPSTSDDSLLVGKERDR
jgi:hypothetical protein